MAFLCAVLAFQRPLFHDEASTLFFAGGEFSHLMEMIRQDVHPPLYFALSWLLLKVFPDSTIALRLMSAVFMGASVTMFLHAIRAWMSRDLSRPAKLSIAIFPFFVFCGYFARYYSLTCLLWATSFLFMGMGRAKKSWRHDLYVGLALAALFFTNYAAALLAFAGFAGGFYGFSRQKKWASLAAATLPAAILFLVWSPILVGQLRYDLPDRVSSGTGLSLVQLVKSGGFLAWTLTVSDGLPPWKIIGIILTAITWGLVLYGTYRLATEKNKGTDAGPLLTLVSMAVVILITGGVIGWVLLPGPMYSFLPPRVAICGFAFLIIAVVVLDFLSSQRKKVIGTLVTVNIIANAYLFSGSYTNWAYAVPAEDIADTVLTFAAESPGPYAVYLPEKSMRNVKHYLERADDNVIERVQLLPHTQELADAARSIVIVRQSKSPEWPPADAVHTALLPMPSGPWRKIKAAGFLKEDEGAGRLKAFVSGQDVKAEKIRVELWRK